MGFRMDNPIKVDDLGYPCFMKPPIMTWFEEKKQRPSWLQISEKQRENQDLSGRNGGNLKLNGYERNQDALPQHLWDWSGPSTKPTLQLLEVSTSQHLAGKVESVECQVALLSKMAACAKI